MKERVFFPSRKAIHGELFTKFQTSFYADAVDAVFKALGVG